MKKEKPKHNANSKKGSRPTGKPAPATRKSTRVYGKLGDGNLFLLTPPWLTDWEKTDNKKKTK